jgi:hypothetical protein
VAVLVEYGVDGGETDEGGLLALDHRKPSDSQDLLLALLFLQPNFQAKFLVRIELDIQ